MLLPTSQFAGLLPVIEDKNGGQKVSFPLCVRRVFMVVCVVGVFKRRGILSYDVKINVKRDRNLFVNGPLKV